MNRKSKTKFIFITGGVLSGVGKGIAAASVGATLEARGLKVNIQKCDPYLNTDAGTLNPGEHGEVFVTDDGAETDLDIGHYERFLDRSLTGKSSLIAGYIFNKVLSQEREGKYLGKTIQIIPHIVDEIQNSIIEASYGFDIHITEIGGTVGDYEGLHFVEAIRRMKRTVGHSNVLYIHVPFLPYLETSKEVKTKPAQNSVIELKKLGVSPDMIFARSDHEITQPLIDKISLYTDVEPEAIIPLTTAKSIYEVPLTIEKYKGTDFVLDKLDLPKRKSNLKEWVLLNKKISQSRNAVKVGLVAKYLSNSDTYISVMEALKSACWANGVDCEIIWIDSEKIEKGKDKILKEVDGIIVPGGFGNRGIEGKVKAAKFARENSVPYLGLCLGMQIATIEFSRYVCGLEGAHSTECNSKANDPVIYFMPGQRNIKKKGGTMRLGTFPCVVKKESISYKAYSNFKDVKKNKDGLLINERHRHRFEFNMKYRDILEKKGFKIAGISPDDKLVEIIEIKGHPFFVGVQFHPEFKSRPQVPHPLFREFIKAVIKSK